MDFIMVCAQYDVTLLEKACKTIPGTLRSLDTTSWKYTMQLIIIYNLQTYYVTKRIFSKKEPMNHSNYAYFWKKQGFTWRN